MASRQMHFLRKYAKPVLAVMGVVCMITFVVGPYLLDWVSGASASRRQDDPVVVTWVKGSVRETDLSDMRSRHNVAAIFMQRVIAATIEAGGSPVVGGQTMSRQTGITSIGFPMDDSDEAIVQTMMLAEEARRVGLSVDQKAVMDFLREISSPELGDAELNEIATDVTKNSALGITVLFEQLATELRAQHVAQCSRSAACWRFRPAKSGIISIG